MSTTDEPFLSEILLCGMVAAPDLDGNVYLWFVVLSGVQFFSVSFAQYWLSKNVPISNENILKSFSASDCFVLILLFENLNPVLFHELLQLLSKKKEQKMKR